MRGIIWCASLALWAPNTRELFTRAARTRLQGKETLATVGRALRKHRLPLEHYRERMKLLEFMIILRFNIRFYLHSIGCEAQKWVMLLQ